MRIRRSWQHGVELRPGSDRGEPAVAVGGSAGGAVGHDGSGHGPATGEGDPDLPAGDWAGSRDGPAGPSDPRRLSRVLAAPPRLHGDRVAGGPAVWGRRAGVTR